MTGSFEANLCTGRLDRDRRIGAETTGLLLALTSIYAFGGHIANKVFV